MLIRMVNGGGCGRERLVKDVVRLSVGIGAARTLSS